MFVHPELLRGVLVQQTSWFVDFGGVELAQVVLVWEPGVEILPGYSLEQLLLGIGIAYVHWAFSLRWARFAILLKLAGVGPIGYRTWLRFCLWRSSLFVWVVVVLEDYLCPRVVAHFALDLLFRVQRVLPDSCLNPWWILIHRKFFSSSLLRLQPIQGEAGRVPTPRLCNLLVLGSLCILPHRDSQQLERMVALMAWPERFDSYLDLSLHLRHIMGSLLSLTRTLQIVLSLVHL